MLKGFLLSVGFNDLNSLLRCRSHKARFSIPERYFPLFFLYKHGRRMCVTRLAHDFWRFCFIMVGQLLDRKHCGRERGDRIGKGPWARTRTRDACRAMALSVSVLPTRLLAPTIATFLRCGVKRISTFTHSAAHQCQFQNSRPIRRPRRRGKSCKLLLTVSSWHGSCFIWWKHCGGM